MADARPLRPDLKAGADGGPLSSWSFGISATLPADDARASAHGFAVTAAEYQ